MEGDRLLEEAGKRREEEGKHLEEVGMPQEEALHRGFIGWAWEVAFVTLLVGEPCSIVTAAKDFPSSFQSLMDLFH